MARSCSESWTHDGSLLLLKFAVFLGLASQLAEPRAVLGRVLCPCEAGYEEAERWGE